MKSTPTFATLIFVSLVCLVAVNVAHVVAQTILKEHATIEDADTKNADAEIEDAENAKRLLENRLFHLQTTRKPGLLIPLYSYPANIHTNDIFNRVIELKRKYHEVPFWVIVNPASGPGNQVDVNYTKAIDRLIGSGCQVLGYVPTGYGKTKASQVETEIKKWREFYPRVQGIFFDEMIYEDKLQGVEHQQRLSRFAHDHGFWPTVGNPGADTPGRYFAQSAADVIVVHEAAQWPTETKLHGNYFGGYSDYPPHTRAVLVHSQPQLSTDSLKMVTQYARWVYVTDDTYVAGDPDHPNPWDQLSSHLEPMCKSIMGD